MSLIDLSHLLSVPNPTHSLTLSFCQCYIFFFWRNSDLGLYIILSFFFISFSSLWMSFNNSVHYNIETYICRGVAWQTLSTVGNWRVLSFSCETPPRSMSNFHVSESVPKQHFLTRTRERQQMHCLCSQAPMLNEVNFRHEGGEKGTEGRQVGKGREDRVLEKSFSLGEIFTQKSLLVLQNYLPGNGGKRKWPWLPRPSQMEVSLVPFQSAGRVKRKDISVDLPLDGAI